MVAQSRSFLKFNCVPSNTLCIITKSTVVQGCDYCSWFRQQHRLVSLPKQQNDKAQELLPTTIHLIKPNGSIIVHTFAQMITGHVQFRVKAYLEGILTTLYDIMEKMESSLYNLRLKSKSELNSVAS